MALAELADASAELDEWRLHLSTLGGSAVTLAIPPDSSVSVLCAKAREALGIGPQGVLLLCHDEATLTDSSVSLSRAGLFDGAKLTVIVRQVLRFEEVLCPRGDDTEGTVALEAQQGSDDTVVARFLPCSRGYRCAVAESLPPNGLWGSMLTRSRCAWDHSATTVGSGKHLVVSASTRAPCCGTTGPRCRIWWPLLAWPASAKARASL
mmetsp:Transcript_885/g.2467  ORF Transcript_885/g.2467 Transcript_885/m.2467 type:complete len:208 (-) Transcript_885:385-1008(-)